MTIERASRPKRAVASTGRVEKVERPIKKTNDENLTSKTKKLLSVLDDTTVKPVQDESPPESAQSSYRQSMKGVSGVLGSLWSSKGHSDAAANKPQEENDLSRTSSSSNDSEVRGTTMTPDDEYVEITRKLMKADSTGKSFHTPPAKGATSPDTQNWLNKSVSKVLGWGQKHDDSPTGHGKEIVENLSNQIVNHASAIAHLLPNLPSQVTAEDLEDLLVWKEPLQSAKVAGLGAYSLLCLQYLVNGTLLVQPSTIIAVCAIFCMVWTSFTPSRPTHASRETTKFEGASDSFLLEDCPALRRTCNSQKEESSISRSQIEDALFQIVNKLIPIWTSVISLIFKHLAGKHESGSKIWLGLLFWTIIIIGEMGWLSQTTLGLYLWFLLFTLPSIFLACKPAFDSLLEEGLKFLSSALNKERRNFTAASCLSSLIIFFLLDTKFFTRVTLSIVSGLACLYGFERYFRLQIEGTQGQQIETSKPKRALKQ